MGAFFGLGFIVGPLVGSLLLRFGQVETIFWFGGIFALIELVLIITHFSNTNVPDQVKKLTYNSFQIILKYLKKPELRNFLISLCLVGVGGFIINASISLYMLSKFGTTGEVSGYVFAFMGVLSAINLGFLAPKFWTKQFSNKQLIVFSHIVFII